VGRKNLYDKAVFWAALAVVLLTASGVAIVIATAEYHPPWTSAWFIVGEMAGVLGFALAVWALALYLAHNHADKHACPDPAAHDVKSEHPVGSVQDSPAQAGSPVPAGMLAAAEAPDQAEHRDAEVSQQNADQATELPAAPEPPRAPHPMWVAAQVRKRGQAQMQVSKSFRHVSAEDQAELRKAIGILLAAHTGDQPEDAFDFSRTQRGALETALGAESRACAILLGLGGQTPTYRRVLFENLGLISSPPELQQPGSSEASRPATPEPANQPL
jgi:hypothetical protein